MNAVSCVGFLFLKTCKCRCRKISSALLLHEEEKLTEPNYSIVNFIEMRYQICSNSSYKFLCKLAFF